MQLDREHRLYQADWLMRFYKFDAAELIDEGQPFLATDIDPKANWAINHLDRFPIEVNTAPYEELLRVPGIGVRGAKAIGVRGAPRRSVKPSFASSAWHTSGLGFSLRVGVAIRAMARALTKRACMLSSQRPFKRGRMAVGRAKCSQGK